MGIDLEAVRRKLKEISRGGGSDFFRPKEGEKHTIRLVPFADNDGQPFKELYFYYNIGKNRGLLAPSQFGRQDPFEELLEKLREDGTKESYELSKKLFPRMRAHAAVVVRGEEAKGVRIWSFGKRVYEQLLRFMLDEDYGDFTDPLQGRDLKLEVIKRPGEKYASTEISLRPVVNKLSDDSDQAGEWMKSIPDVVGLYEEKDYDTLSNIINRWLSGDDEAEGSDSSTRFSDSAKSDDDDDDDDSSSSSAITDLDAAFRSLKD